MKIAFFSPLWPAARAHNGIATYVDVMTRSLEKAGHECVIITPHHRDEGETGNVYLSDGASHKSAHSLISKIRRRFSNPFTLYNDFLTSAVADAIERASKTGPIDFLEMEETSGWAAQVQTKVDCPVLIRTHGPHFLVGQDTENQKTCNRVKMEGKALTSARAVSSPSKGVLDDIEAQYGAIKAHKAVIPNPVIFADEQSRWRFDECDPNLLLFVGRFDHLKGADLVLDAFARLLKRFPSLRLVMVGKDLGLPTDGGEALTFEPYAEKYLAANIRARIEFLGPVPQSKLHELRKQAFLCLTASRFECFPYAVTEALAMGCPVVTTRTYGPPDFLEHGKEIMVAELGAAEQLTDHIAELLADPQKARTLAAAGLAGAKQHLAPEAVVDSYLHFCRTVLGEASPGPRGAAPAFMTGGA